MYVAHTQAYSSTQAHIEYLSVCENCCKTTLKITNHKRCVMKANTNTHPHTQIIVCRFLFVFCYEYLSFVVCCLCKSSTFILGGLGMLCGGLELPTHIRTLAGRICRRRKSSTTIRGFVKSEAGGWRDICPYVQL